MIFDQYLYLHGNSRTRSLRLGQTMYKITYRGIEKCRVKDVSWWARRCPGPARGYCVYYWPDTGAPHDLQYGVELVHTKAFAMKIQLSGERVPSRRLYPHVSSILTKLYFRNQKSKKYNDDTSHS